LIGARLVQDLCHKSRVNSKMRSHERESRYQISHCLHTLGSTHTYTNSLSHSLFISLSLIQHTRTYADTYTHAVSHTYAHIHIHHNALACNSHMHTEAPPSPNVIKLDAAQKSLISLPLPFFPSPPFSYTHTNPLPKMLWTTPPGKMYRVSALDVEHHQWGA